MKKLRDIVPLNELKILKMFTMAPADLKPGDNLKSLTTQIGRKKAQKQYVKKWSHILTKDHPALKTHSKYVHLSDPKNMLDSPVDDTPRYPIVKEPHAKEINQVLSKVSKHLGKPHTLYDIRPGRHMANVERDKHEYDHPMVKGHIPGKYIRNKWNIQKGKWERFK